MSARISIADLSDATGISPDLLAAEVEALQRASVIGQSPPSSRRGERLEPPRAQDFEGSSG
jgi:hypothetical protein